MKKLLSVLAILLVLGPGLSASVLADEVRGAELQLVVTEPPAPTPEDNPAHPSGNANPATGQGQAAGAAAGILAATALALAAAKKKKKTAK